MFGGLAAGPLGRGRRSICVDPRQAGGAEVVLRLIERSEAMASDDAPPPGRLERLRAWRERRLGITTRDTANADDTVSAPENSQEN